MPMLCCSIGNRQQVGAAWVQRLHGPLQNVQVAPCCGTRHVPVCRHGRVPEQACLCSRIHFGGQKGCMGVDPQQELQIALLCTLKQVSIPFAALTEEPWDKVGAAMSAGCLKGILPVGWKVVVEKTRGGKPLKHIEMPTCEPMRLYDTG